MIVIDSSNTICRLNDHITPVATVFSGHEVLFKTVDCFSDRLGKDDNVLSNLPWDSINPCTGPLFISDAKPGDILKVSILKINIHDYGTLIIDKSDTERYGIDLGQECSWRVSIENNSIILNNKNKIKAKPMIGVIATAPEGGDVLTTAPGEHGGNLDCNKITEGSIVYLPVNQNGALLSIGDLHAAMGDGELTGCGVEVSGEVLVKVEVITDYHMPTPLVILNDSAYIIASAATLDQATDFAVKKLLSFLLNDKKMDIKSAWEVLCVLVNIQVCQKVNSLKTVRCEIPAFYFQ